MTHTPNTKLKVGMLILMEHDLDAAVTFYKQLGLELKFHLKEKWAEFNIGDIKIGLCPTETEPFRRHTGIVLEVSDLNALHQELKALGLKFLWDEPKEAAHGIMLGIEDPNGNILDLYQPTPEKIHDLVHKTATAGQDSCCSNNKTTNTDNDTDQCCQTATQDRCC